MATTTQKQFSCALWFLKNIIQDICSPLSHIKKDFVRLVRHEISEEKSSNNFLIYNLPFFENLFVWQEIKKVWMDPSTKLKKL